MSTSTIKSINKTLKAILFYGIAIALTALTIQPAGPCDVPIGLLVIFALMVACPVLLIYNLYKAFRGDKRYIVPSMLHGLFTLCFVVLICLY